MKKRFMCIWFGHLLTDWVTIRKPGLKDTALVIAAPERGRMIITAANQLAEQQGIYKGTTVADARAALRLTRKGGSRDEGVEETSAKGGGSRGHGGAGEELASIER